MLDRRPDPAPTDTHNVSSERTQRTCSVRAQVGVDVAARLVVVRVMSVDDEALLAVVTVRLAAAPRVVGEDGAGARPPPHGLHSVVPRTHPETLVVTEGKRVQ